MFTIKHIFITYFFKDCVRTRTLKCPHHGPSTRMRKILLKRLKKNINDQKQFKRLKRNKKMLLIINGSEVPIHQTFERRQIVRGWKGRRR